MSKQNLTWLIVVIIIAVVAAVFLWRLWGSSSDETPAETTNKVTTDTKFDEVMPGSDRDEHGCIPSAGYVWCEDLGKCVRPWEEECPGLGSGETQEKEDTASVNDDRILLNSDNITEYCNPAVDLPACEAESFNVDPPSTTVSFVDQDNGLAFDVPYNPSWGSENYRIKPYEAEGDFVFFGPMAQFEAGGWARPFWMLGYVDAMPADELVETIKNSPDSTSDVDPEIVNINGLEVVRFKEMGLGEHYMMEVIGTKHNYRFVNSNFSGKDVDMWAQMEPVVGSVELL